jgi:tetratricopeptide (TPR) repeat protein
MAKRPAKSAHKKLADHLAQGEASGLIRVAQLEPELEYLFRHALVQDAIYGVTLKQDRKLLHQAVGEALEVLYPDRVEELAPTLAYHFDQAGDAPRALSYLTLAGDQAAGRFALDEAIQHYRRALELARATTADTDSLIHLFTALGRAMELSNQYGEALAAYDQMAADALKRGDRRLEIASLTARATVLSTTNAFGDPAKALTLMERASQLAEEIGDRPTEARILWNIMLALIFGNGDLHEAVRAGERSIAISREFNLREQLAFSLNDIFMAYWVLHDYDKAYTVHPEAAALWRELGNLPMLTDNLAARSNLAVIQGDYETGMRFSAEGFQVSQNIGHVWGMSATRLLVGRAYWELGQVDTALHEMEDAVQQGDAVSYSGAMIVTRADLGILYGQLGAAGRGLALIERGFTLIGPQPTGFTTQLLPWLWACTARLHLMQGDVTAAALAVDRAHEHFIRAAGFIPVETVVKFAEAELARAQGDAVSALQFVDSVLNKNRHDGTRIHFWDALLLKAEALIATGDLNSADQPLTDAQDDAEEHGARWSLWRILAARADLAARQGRDEDAKALRAQARPIVEDIAASLEDNKLRKSFLATTAVKGIKK